MDVKITDKLIAIKNHTKILIDNTQKLCEASDELLGELEESGTDTSDFTLASASMYVKSSLMEANRLLQELNEIGSQPLKEYYCFKTLSGAFTDEPEEAKKYYTLEAKDIVVGNGVSSPNLGNWVISKILSENFFEATQGDITREFMLDGRSHWNDSIPTVYKCTYFQQEKA